jgi:hypothetical protein
MFVYGGRRRRRVAGGEGDAAGMTGGISMLFELTKSDIAWMCLSTWRTSGSAKMSSFLYKKSYFYIC